MVGFTDLLMPIVFGVLLGNIVFSLVKAFLKRLGIYKKLEGGEEDEEVPEKPASVTPNKNNPDVVSPQEYYMGR